MSTSETITRTDLTNILNEILPPTTLNPWVAMYATSVSANNTATKVTGASIKSGGNASDYFDTSTADQVTIKRAGKYKVTLFFRATAITTASNVKRVSCYKGGTESCAVLARLNSWEDASGFHVIDCSANDVLTVYRRAEDGGSTFSPISMMIEALDATTGNISAEADYIVEQGTSGDWTYRKWNSGRMEAEADVTTSSSSWTSVVTNIYYNVTILTPPTGMTVTSGYATLKQGSNYIVNAQVQIGTDITMVLHRVASSSVSFNCHVVLNGTWK